MSMYVCSRRSTSPKLANSEITFWRYFPAPHTDAWLLRPARWTLLLSGTPLHCCDLVRSSSTKCTPDKSRPSSHFSGALSPTYNAMWLTCLSVLCSVTAHCCLLYRTSPPFISYTVICKFIRFSNSSASTSSRVWWSDHIAQSDQLRTMISTHGGTSRYYTTMTIYIPACECPF